ncbi:MAG: MoaD/ThiS family protein [Candidatus Binatia bacterium]
MITVEVTYDMAKALGGVRRFEVAAARTVADVVRLTRERFGAQGEAFEKLSRVAAVAVNGVLSNHRKGMHTPLADGDTVTFVKAAAGG